MRHNPTTSFIIRTYNEQKWLATVLDTLFSQSRLDFEVIIVDSGSTDSTISILNNYPISSIISIPKKKHNHAYAANLGIQAAKGTFVGFLSGHSVPVSRTWYADGLTHFNTNSVVAVGGYQTSLPDASVAEKAYDLLIGESITEKHWNVPWISNANALYRKEQLLEYPFDERITKGIQHYKFIKSGGEDYDFLQEMLSRGWTTVIDPSFNVYHSHGGLNRPSHQDMSEEWQSLCTIIDQKRRPSYSYSEIYNGEVKKKWRKPSITGKLISFILKSISA